MQVGFLVCAKIGRPDQLQARVVFDDLLGLSLLNFGVEAVRHLCQRTPVGAGQSRDGWGGRGWKWKQLEQRRQDQINTRWTQLQKGIWFIIYPRDCASTYWIPLVLVDAAERSHVFVDLQKWFVA